MNQTQTRPESASLVRHEPIGVARKEKLDLTKPYLQEIKKIFMKGASDEEFALCAGVVEATGLDIFNKEIFWIPKIGPYISHKGYWALAMRSGMFDGFAPHVFLWKDANGVLNQNRNGTIFSVKASAWRKDMRFPVVYECLYSEWSVESNPKWRNMPENMLSLRTERCTLFRAFPVSGAQLGKGIDEDYLMETIPGEIIEPKFITPAVSVGSALPKPERAVADLSASAPVEKPALQFATVERAKAEFFSLINNVMAKKPSGVTPAKLIQVAWADMTADSETIGKCSDLEKLNSAYSRLQREADAMKESNNVA